MTDEREGRRRDGGARMHPRLTVTRFTSSVTMPTRHSADRLLHISQPWRPLWTLNWQEVDNFTEDLSAIQQVLHRSNNITDIGHPLRKIIPFGHLSQLQLQVIIFSSPLQQDCDMCSELPGVPADLQHWSSQINPPNWTLANLVAQTGCKTEQACLRIHKICMVYLQYQQQCLTCASQLCVGCTITASQQREE